MGFLEALSVSKVFGGIAALDHIDLSIKEGEILGLIGPNGAGKTTFFNVLTGLYKPDKGEILFREGNWPYRRILRACNRLLAPRQEPQPGRSGQRPAGRVRRLPP